MIRISKPSRNLNLKARLHKVAVSCCCNGGHTLMEVKMKSSFRSLGFSTKLGDPSRDFSLFGERQAVKNRALFVWLWEVAPVLMVPQLKLQISAETLHICHHICQHICHALPQLELRPGCPSPSTRSLSLCTQRLVCWQSFGMPFPGMARAMLCQRCFALPICQRFLLCHLPLVSSKAQPCIMTNYAGF